MEAKEIKREIIFSRYLVKSLASGGRKFGINLILINHSFNCTALKIDSNHRNNFVGIFLNEAADNYVSRAGYANQKVKEWVIKTRVNKYRAVITGAMKDSPILHPTHHDYAKVEDGQKSKLLIELVPSELTIKAVSNGVIVPSGTSYNQPSVNCTIHQADGLVEGSKPLSVEDCTSVQIPNNPPKNPDLEGMEKADGLTEFSPEDLERLEQIHDFWAQGERRLKIIIPAVWGDIDGTEKLYSRAYRKCREEYRRLTGK